MRVKKLTTRGPPEVVGVIATGTEGWSVAGWDAAPVEVVGRIAGVAGCA